MNELALEWIEKAEGDFVTATELLRLGLDLTADAICFHCQQCAEKYTKAYLQNLLVEFPRTHNLLQLLMLCEAQDATFAALHLELQILNSYSVEIRYPGRFSNLEEARSAVAAMSIVRDFIRSKLDL